MNKSFFAEILARKPELVTSMLRFNSFQQSSTMPNAIKNLAQYGIDSEKLWNIPLIRQKYLKKALDQNTQAENTQYQNIKHFKNILEVTDAVTTEVTDIANLASDTLNIINSVDSTGANQEFTVISYWDFAEESKRLALMDQKTLQELIIYLGTVLNAQEIAHCIEREKVLSIKKIIGFEAYAYALGRGQFQFGNKKAIKGLLPAFVEEGSFFKRIFLQGIYILYICTHDWTEDLRHIFYTKIIAIMCENRNNTDLDMEELKIFLENFSFEDVSQATKRHVWFSLKKILTKELVPSWLPYFD